MSPQGTVQPPPGFFDPDLLGPQGQAPPPGFHDPGQAAGIPVPLQAIPPNPTVQAFQDLQTGFGRSAAQTAQTLGNVVQQIPWLGAALKQTPVIGTALQSLSATQIPAPENDAQKTGAILERTLEFMAPGAVAKGIAPALQLGAAGRAALLGTLTGGVSLAHGDSQMNALINALTAGGVQAGSEYLQSLSPASRQVLVHRLGQFLDTAAVGAAFRGNYGIGAGAFGAGQAVRTPWFQNLFSMAPRIAPAVVPPALGVMNVLNPSPSSEK